MAAEPAILPRQCLMRLMAIVVRVASKGALCRARLLTKALERVVCPLAKSCRLS